MSSKKILDSDIISSIFVRKKINSKVIMSFKSFPNETKNYVLHEVALETDEKPSILNFLSVHHWCLITNKRFVWEVNQKRNSLYYEIMKSADINKEEMFRIGASFKSQTQEINIKIKSGESILVDIGEAGASLFAVLNVLSWVIAKNKDS
ncbi:MULTISPECIES: hypothetical protein [Nostocales]|uniref:Uncharacterized protein n=3 Tax=Nostocales TaxID=1161 RepID=A0A0C1RB54_9CYAN|nr:hypothetical protein [Tolypothrix bouteillei]KAF3888206.1 hypothetical protein DA73_0400023970 [Tolypothrix bouteillei VB521301]